MDIKFNFIFHSIMLWAVLQKVFYLDYPIGRIYNLC